MFITADGNYSTFHFIVRTDRDGDITAGYHWRCSWETDSSDRADRSCISQHLLPCTRGHEAAAAMRVL
ncbi:MAG: hypothetical protein MZV63_37680 [Marinilabiliales bacterium]|nr:hypothetical protein [Marinilabiliales bacterium]